MKIENIRATIRALEAANNFDMAAWQYNANDKDKICTTIEEANDCGTSACIGGYSAMTPEFKSEGGFTYKDRTFPCIRDNKGTLYTGAAALGYFWGVPLVISAGVCGVDYIYVELPSEHGTYLYPRTLASSPQTREFILPESIYDRTLLDASKADAIDMMKAVIALGLFLEAATLEPFRFSFNGILNNGVNYDEA